MRKRHSRKLVIMTALLLCSSFFVMSTAKRFDVGPSVEDVDSDPGVLIEVDNGNKSNEKNNDKFENKVLSNPATSNKGLGLLYDKPSKPGGKPPKPEDKWEWGLPQSLGLTSSWSFGSLTPTFSASNNSPYLATEDGVQTESAFVVSPSFSGWQHATNVGQRPVPLLGSNSLYNNMQPQQQPQYMGQQSQNSAQQARPPIVSPSQESQHSQGSAQQAQPAAAASQVLIPVLSVVSGSSQHQTPSPFYSMPKPTTTTPAPEPEPTDPPGWAVQVPPETGWTPAPQPPPSAGWSPAVQNGWSPTPQPAPSTGWPSAPAPSTGWPSAPPPAPSTGWSPAPQPPPNTGWESSPQPAQSTGWPSAPAPVPSTGWSPAPQPPPSTGWPSAPPPAQSTGWSPAPQAPPSTGWPSAPPPAQSTGWSPAPQPPPSTGWQSAPQPAPSGWPSAPQPAPSTGWSPAPPPPPPASGGWSTPSAQSGWSQPPPPPAPTGWSQPSTMVSAQVGWSQQPSASINSQSGWSQPSTSVSAQVGWTQPAATISTQPQTGWSSNQHQAYYLPQTPLQPAAPFSLYQQLNLGLLDKDPQSYDKSHAHGKDQMVDHSVSPPPNANISQLPPSAPGPPPVYSQHPQPGPASAYQPPVQAPAPMAPPPVPQRPVQAKPQPVPQLIQTPPLQQQSSGQSQPLMLQLVYQDQGNQIPDPPISFNSPSIISGTSSSSDGLLDGEDDNPGHVLVPPILNSEITIDDDKFFDNDDDFVTIDKDDEDDDDDRLKKMKE